MPRLKASPMPIALWTGARMIAVEIDRVTIVCEDPSLPVSQRQSKRQMRPIKLSAF
jgi:hypothetical protein